jgi:glycosyltransferase involved in cell wall biosynthesis
LDDKFVVLYSGNLGVCHDVATLAEMIELMRNQPVEFIFVVNEVGRRNLEQRIGRNPHVHFKPFQPREALPAVLATADVGLITLGRGMSRFVVPCKTFGIMAAGRPLLAVSDLQDDLYRIVHDSKGGVWAPAGNAPAIARAILGLQQNASRRAGMGRAARQYVEREHSLEVALSAWLNWLSGDEGREPKMIERRMAA